ncbi:hypothetical protein LMH87_010183 [Akanthomyces muscarius]|uniref:Uncharacterized protein n=1 Tax=Akanthomyces muscarius TaxID=2231603 RepID=A0A9W8QG56_AKAMU|nr:hypothetical protein LMH87_010183 [Akanthomyces muscarius]KAJ4153709.1 hypothetical protein LMH87_010183 [Akanthomyces muscarius]
MRNSQHQLDGSHILWGKARMALFLQASVPGPSDAYMCSLPRSISAWLPISTSSRHTLGTCATCKMLPDFMSFQIIFRAIHLLKQYLKHMLFYLM